MQRVGRQCVEGAVVRSCQSFSIERPKLEEPATPEAPHPKEGSSTCDDCSSNDLLKSWSLIVRVVYYIRKTMIMIMMMMMMMMSHGP